MEPDTSQVSLYIISFRKHFLRNGDSFEKENMYRYCSYHNTIVCLYLLQCLLVPKYASDIKEGAMIEEYYNSEKNHDVLILGDCKYMRIYPRLQCGRIRDIKLYPWKCGTAYMAVVLSARRYA